MFDSLDRLDIELKPDETGRRHFLQTDHRPRADMEAQPDLSTLFAVIRVLYPMRVRGDAEPVPVVSYSVVEQPPQFLADAVAAAGGRLIEDVSIHDPIPVAHVPALRDVVTSAMSGLVRATMAEHGVSFDIAGLLAVERTVSATPLSADENASLYWEAVLKLGSFAGELIRASNGGRWEAAGPGSFPIALITSFRGGEATVNPLGKAIKRFDQGEDERVVTLVKVVQGGYQG